MRKKIVITTGDRSGVCKGRRSVRFYDIILELINLLNHNIILELDQSGCSGVRTGPTPMDTLSHYDLKRYIYIYITEVHRGRWKDFPLLLFELRAIEMRIRISDHRSA